MADSYYRNLGGGRFEATIHAQGAWNTHEQHMAPASGLIAHCLELFQPRKDLRIARISYEILGLIPLDTIEVTAQMVRPGRTIELLEAEMNHGGRTAIRARAWRLATSDTASVAAVEEETMPGPDDAEAYDAAAEWPGGYIQSIEVRNLPERRPGRARVWLRTGHALVEGEPSSDMARLTGLIDTANGVATRVRPGKGSWAFPNVDLQVHIHRQPSGRWLGLDTRVTFGTDGVGLTSAVLHDLDGPFGRSEQILTLRKLP
ncbi:thioesterase family protein [Arthrobacter sp. JZ12]|uniref:thioesterase family protein n=1 Tax=Arthrobacter sp. JZ12 TaxID=2654190 RepID=UPI002B468E5B|nr:thioesterase family protein [Arthrobacter sp. JZ12]WRH24822.1 thioesterase family protein [Arthrobacter sp. JZ12]